ncbi:MAG: hypothetical protein ACJ0A2_05960 [Alphaproteobacteria bacterium]|nr:hypothetical protein [Rhodobiaceae bacterium]|tara:strand:+ start:901 stop:1203 length:303 start_codon:yes stop_codon:yes gene_type:complete
MLPYHLKDKPKSSYEVFRNAIFMSVTSEDKDLAGQYLEVAKILASKLSEIEMKRAEKEVKSLMERLEEEVVCKICNYQTFIKDLTMDKCLKCDSLLDITE